MGLRPTLRSGLTSLALTLFLGGSGCKKGTSDVVVPPPPPPGSTPAPTPVAPEDDGPLGFVGAPCEGDMDCHEGGVCLTEGYPRGMCSEICDQFCPDAEDHPTTFCVQGSDLDPATAALGDGACHARCDFGFFPDSGCRPGYGCVVAGRANQAVENWVCLPGVATVPPSECEQELAQRGVRFERIIIADQSPEGSSQVCHVEEPVRVHSPILDVELVYGNSESGDPMWAACDMANALADTVADVKPLGVTTIRHLGTYNCRTIAGSSNLSRHGMGDAIDISGFDFADGTQLTLIADWVHDDPSPATFGGAFLYDAAYRWHDAQYWNTILTPDYNEAHDNHFHVDLTPGRDFIGRAGIWLDLEHGEPSRDDDAAILYP